MNTPSRDGSREVLEPMEAPKRLAFLHDFPHASHYSYIIFRSDFANSPEPTTVPCLKP
jgi:hypothetical protein